MSPFGGTRSFLSEAIPKKAGKENSWTTQLHTHAYSRHVYLYLHIHTMFYNSNLLAIGLVNMGNWFG